MQEKSKLTIDQVALLAGVSRSVVSRVLNHHANVSEEARERVLRVIEAHNYRPSSVARSLATDRTYEICVITPRRRDDAIANGYWPLLHLGISEQCIRRGYFVSLTMISAETAGEINERILNERVFDGYLLITEEVTGLVAPGLHERQMPVVLIGHDAAHPEFNAIDVDNFDGAYRATRYLIELGHRRIALILGNPEMQESLERRSGYLQALADQGIEPDPDLIAAGPYAEQSGYDVMGQWLQTGACPPAVFCGSDAIATGVLLALYEAGRAVPAEVSVMGFDDVPGSAFTIPPLTTVHQPIYEKGEQAADLLINQIEGKRSAPVHVRLKPELVVRRSCGPRPVNP